MDLFKNAFLKPITYLIVFTLLSCNPKEIEFNKSKWVEKVDGFYLHREEMIRDLTENHLYKGMTYREVKNLLGKPDEYSDLGHNIIAYGIMEDYGWNIDPIETKTLRIELTKDSLVNSFEIIHWKN